MSDMFRDGLLLTVLGMGTVFGFLILLIVAVTVLSAVLKRFEAAPVEPPPRRTPQVQPEVAVVAAIAHAAHQQR